LIWQEPGATKVKEVPLTVQTLVVSELNVTASEEEAVAVRVDAVAL
jgi:hypothetical protein